MGGASAWASAEQQRPWLVFNERLLCAVQCASQSVPDGEGIGWLVSRLSHECRAQQELRSVPQSIPVQIKCRSFK